VIDYPPVLTKADFVRRFQLNEFGNRGMVWNTVDDYLADIENNQKGLYHLRNRVAGGPTHYNQTYEDVVYFEHDNRSKIKQWYVAAMAPHHRNLIQGEVALLPEITLRYSSVPDVPMREALAIGEKHVTGIIANSLLRYYLCPNSYEWLQILLERYSGHVVEFSSVSCNWGTLPHYNTVFWEVRLY